MSPRTTEQLESIRADRRQSILDAALEIFAEQTYHATSVNQIAKRAGVSKGLIYNYFSSKEELLNTLVMEIADRYMERIHLPESGILTDDYVSQFIDMSFEMILEDLDHAKLFFSLYTQKEVMNIMYDKMIERVIPYMNALLAYFESKGHENPMSVVKYFSASIDGVQMHLLSDTEFPLGEVKQMIKKQFIQ